MNLVWALFFLVGFATALVRWAGGDSEVFQQLVNASFDMATLSVDIAIGLIGLLALWSGLFAIAEKTGVIHWFGRGLAPLFRRLMPEVPAGHEAQGAITMNLAANMLGLDNAATPLGIKAMQALQTLNPLKDTASNAQILFLVLNTSSVTLLPVTIFMYRTQLGAANPADVFVPILLATTASTLTGLLAVMWWQKIRLDAVLLAYLGGLLALVATMVFWLGSLPVEQLADTSQQLANGIIMLLIVSLIAAGLWRRQPVYEQFVCGAKSGFETAVQLIPYLLAMLVAIGVFRASGALDLLLDGVRWLLTVLGVSTLFVDALPVALMKPFSGSGARAMMLDVMNSQGVDSVAGHIAAVMQGSTETTFYVLAVYFGVVGITRIRYALWAGLLCDGVGMITAVVVGLWFFDV
ncbi:MULTISPECIES: nucleoside recognition domain-containing protein [unclassified Oceanobacter]|uniref:nucleoside recognition domain-containing protein n=1 Tax=unclassified Oceanobacter TaxID=2620260 RepID=UPI00273316BE|nr:MULTISPECIES: nucleoside recognition domain-containing protein [unclassified Oceanobacter]MDP2609926.1 nucleoside recognition domain-containing protein [Oceanobacter sp. 1_MG-2023]MDP2613192.1 nucleoside recognition domain-containing protein [Oceanobacter sp. 2_MG-2023]